MSNEHILRLLLATVAAASLVNCSADSPRDPEETSGNANLRGARPPPRPKLKALDGGHGAKPTHDAQVTPKCPDPPLGSGFVTLTGAAVDICQAGDTSHCSGPGFIDPNDVALGYGSFPFSRDAAGRYFYAVVAAGYEETGIFQGAAGNLSDDTPSSVAGDLGSGDTLADRTIVITDDQIVRRFPQSAGTHTVSLPPSQFVTIHLAPFDTTPEGKYVLAICPETATARCECAFDAFTVVPTHADGGPEKEAGTGGAGGAHDAGSPDAHADGGKSHDAGTAPIDDAACPADK